MLLLLSTGVSASAVFGQSNFTSSGASGGLNELNYPSGIAVDGSGNLYVADQGNTRVLRYANAATASNGSNGVVIGSGWNSPYAVAIDGSNNLYVCDQGNERVDRIPNASTANSSSTRSASFGGTGAVSSTTMSYPYSISIDNAGNLFVADGYHRVLRFSNAATASTGVAADLVLGQANFTSSAANRGGSASENTFSSPTHAFVDASGNLFVSDFSNNRVLRFVGFGSPTTTATASPTSVSFGTNFVGGATTSQSVTLTITNVNTNDSFTYTLSGNTTGVSLSETTFTTSANTSPFSRTFTLSLATGTATTVSGFLYIRSAGSSTTLATINLSGIVVPVTTMTVSATSVNFGQTPRYVLAPQQTVVLTIANARAGERFTYSLPINPGTAYSLGTNLGFTTNASSSLFTTTITLSLSANTVGNFIGALRISTNSSTTPTDVSLLGIINGLTVTFSTTSVNFGTVNISPASTVRQSTQAVVITWDNASSASSLTLSTTGVVFLSTRTTINLPTTSGSVTLPLTYAPVVAGTSTGTLTVTGNVGALARYQDEEIEFGGTVDGQATRRQGKSGGSEIAQTAQFTTQVINLTGIATISTSANASSSAVSFGTNFVGSATTTQSVTLSIGNANNSDTFNYTLGGNTTGITLNETNFTTNANAAQFNRSITLSVNPTAVNTINGVLWVNSTQSGSTTLATINLSGIVVPVTTMTVSATSLNFGQTPRYGLATTQSIVLMIANARAGERFTYSLPTNPGGGVYGLNSVGFTTNANSTLFTTTITLSLSANTVGNFAGVLRISTNSSTTPTDVNLSGIINGLTVTFSTTSVNFGTVNIAPASTVRTSTQALVMTWNHATECAYVRLSTTGIVFLNTTGTATTGDTRRFNFLTTSGSVSIPLTYAPTVVGTSTGTLFVEAVATTLLARNTEDDTPEFGSVSARAKSGSEIAQTTEFTNFTINLTGSASTNTSATASVNSLNFGTNFVGGATTTQSVTLSINSANSGDTFNYTFGGNSTGISANETNFTTSANAAQFNRTITLSLNPAVASTRNGVMWVNSAQGGSTIATITLSGNVFPVTTLTVSPTSVNLGAPIRNVNNTSTQTVTLTFNNIRASEHVTYTLLNNGSNFYRIQTNNISNNLSLSFSTNANQAVYTTTVTIQAIGTFNNPVGAYNSTLRVTVASSTTPVDVAIIGSIVDLTGTVNTNTLNFGSLAAIGAGATQTSSTQTVTLTWANAVANNTQVNLATTGTAFSSTQTSITLPTASGSMPLTLTYRPIAVGTQTGTFTLTGLSQTNEDCGRYDDDGSEIPTPLLQLGVQTSKEGDEIQIDAGDQAFQLVVNLTGVATFAIPQAPVAIAGTSITTTSFTANWNASGGATSYLLDIATDANFANRVVNNQTVNTTSFAFTSGSANTTYFVRVRASNVQGTSDNSNTIQVLTLPNAPQNLTASGIGASSATLSWAVPSGGAASYTVDVSTTSAFTSFVGNFNNQSISALTVSTSGLQQGTTYFWRARSVNATGTSANSTVQNFTTLFAPVLTSFAPNPIAQGQTLTLVGNFFASPMTVNVGGVMITANVVNATTATIVIPTTVSGVQSVSITTPGGNATNGQSLTILAPPTVTSVTPNSLLVPSTTTSFTIVGTNFTNATLTLTASGSANATNVSNVITSSSATQIVVNLGANLLATAGRYTFTVTNLAGSASGIFNINLPPPTITDLQPRVFAVGQTITITGTNFIGASVVTLGGVNLTNFTVVNANTITAVVSGPPSGSIVTVQTGSGTARAEFNYTFIAGPSFEVSPNSLAVTPIVTNRQPVILTLTGVNMVVPGTNGTAQVGTLTLTRPDGTVTSLNGLVVNPFNLTLTSSVFQISVPFDQLQTVGNYTLTLTTAGGSASRSVTVFQDQFGVSGTIQRTDQPNAGTDMSGIVVTLSGNGIQPRTVQTNSAGAYSFGNVQIGTYTVSYATDRFFISASSRTVVVQGTTVIPNPNVVRLQTFSISGFVTTGTSTNSVVLPNPEVNYTNTTGTIVGRDIGNSSGFFLIGGLPPGQYYLTIASTLATFTPILVTIGDRDVVIDGGFLRGSIINRNTSASTSVAVQGSANIGTVTDEFRNVPSTAGNLTVIVTRTPDFGDLVLTTRPTVNVVMARDRGYDPIVLEAQSLEAQSIVSNDKRSGEITQVAQERLLRLGDTVSLADVQNGRVVYRPRVQQTQTDTIRFNINYSLGSNTIVNSVVTMRFNVAQRPPRITAIPSPAEITVRANERPGIQWFIADDRGSFDYAGVDSIRVTRVVSSNETLLRASNLVFGQFDRSRWHMTMPLERNTTGTTVITATFTLNFNGFTETSTQSMRVNVLPATSIRPVTEVIQSLQPNPARDMVQIVWQGKRTESVRLTIVNVLGQAVQMLTVERGVEQTQIDVSRLSAGTYRVMIEDSRGMTAQALVVVR
jgi:hypothetical protein